MSTTTPPPATRSPLPYLPTASVVILVVAILGSTIEVILAKGALDVVLNESEFISAITAIGLTVIAVGAAVSAGLALRHGHRLLGGIALTAWLLIGIALAYMRWNKGTFAGDIENSIADRALAMIMIAVYVAAGIEIAIHGSRLLAAGAYFRTRSAHRAVNRLIKHRTAVLAQYGRVSVSLKQFGEKRTRASRQHNLAQNTIDHLERELAAFTRDRIAEALAGPEHTGVIRQPVVGDIATERVDAAPKAVAATSAERI